MYGGLAGACDPENTARAPRPAIAPSFVLPACLPPSLPHLVEFLPTGRPVLGGSAISDLKLALACGEG